MYLSKQIVYNQFVFVSHLSIIGIDAGVYFIFK